MVSTVVTFTVGAGNDNDYNNRFVFKLYGNKLWKREDHGSDWHSRYEIGSEVKVVLEYDRLISLGVLLKHPLESEFDVGVDSAHRC